MRLDKGRGTTWSKERTCSLSSGKAFVVEKRSKLPCCSQITDGKPKCHYYRVDFLVSERWSKDWEKERWQELSCPAGCCSLIVIVIRDISHIVSWGPSSSSQIRTRDQVRGISNSLAACCGPETNLQMSVRIGRRSLLSGLNLAGCAWRRPQ